MRKRCRQSPSDSIDCVAIDDFSLIEDLKEGFIDDNGNFVISNQDDDDEAWLKNVELGDIEVARAAYDKKGVEKDEVLISELVVELSECLEPEETPLEALMRYKIQPDDDKVQRLEKKYRIGVLTDFCCRLLDLIGPEVYELRLSELVGYLS